MQESEIATIAGLVAVATFATIGLVIAVSKGKDPVSWAIFSALAAVIALPILIFAAPANGAAKPYARKALSILAGGAVVFVAVLVTGSATVGYNCDNLRPEILALSEKNAGAVTIAGIFDVKEISRGEQSVRCQGTARLSNSTDVQAMFGAKFEHDQWWVDYRLN